MKRIIVLIIAAFFLQGIAHAQTPFFSTVKVEFEKTIYVRQQYKELVPDWFERIKDHLPATSISYFDFIGDTTKSIYKPGRDGVINGEPRVGCRRCEQYHWRWCRGGGKVLMLKGERTWLFHFFPLFISLSCIFYFFFGKITCFTSCRLLKYISSKNFFKVGIN